MGARSVQRVAGAGAVVALLVLGCGSGAPVGPLEIDVPSGWQVTRDDSRGMQIADGTAGNGGLEAGTATAVFDIILDAPHTAGTFREHLRDVEVEADEERFRIDGYEAIAFRYSAREFGGTQENIFIPDYGIQIVYRAAFPLDDEAFEEGLPAFREAVRSIRFVAQPSPDPA